MFLAFFYALREEKVPVAIQDWLALVEALQKGLHRTALTSFYNVARACLIKTEANYDAFDRAFLRVFSDVEGALSVDEEILKWLEDARNVRELTPEQLNMLKALTAQELMDQLQRTLEEQRERHDGGSRWVGTGGTSPHGNNGVHPTGIRVGGQSRNRSAMKVAQSRSYVGYRTDLTMDVRQMKMALRRLRTLTRVGTATELDLDGTIDETCRNAGEIEFKFRPPRRNDVRLLLLLDVGGTMDPHAHLMGQLVSALKQSHGLRECRSYYFHNCIYHAVYQHPWLRPADAVPVAQLMRELDGRWKLMVVGDAAMHPAELLGTWGAIDHLQAVEKPGVEWLQILRRHFERAVWVNPDPSGAWGGRTTQVIRGIFPMYQLSVQGLEDAVRALVGGRRGAVV
jgi:uncharacterized protein with von Willebrand factor type A (vWA) domain